MVELKKKIEELQERKEPNIKTFLENKKIDLVINITDRFFKQNIDKDYLLRRTTIDCNVSLFTDLQSSKLFVRSLKKLKQKEIDIFSETQ